MKYLATLIALVCLAGCTSKSPSAADKQFPQSEDGGHGADKSHSGHQAMAMPAATSAITVMSRPEAPRAGEPVELRLMIHQPDGAKVEEFDELHTKKVHLIIIRKALDEFAHVHPDIDASGNMTVMHTFPLGGEYLLFADYKPAGKAAATATGRIKVSGDSPAAPKLTPNVPGVVEGDGLDARVDLKNARAGGSATVVFHVLDKQGKPVDDLEPYLGAMGHLVIVSADGKEYVHAHPLSENSADGGVVEFMAHFPKPGIYKGWGQFQQSDTVYTAPFVVSVD